VERSKREAGSSPTRSQRSPVVEAIAGVVCDLQRALGPNAEVVLHDVQNLQDGIIAIAGEVTERSVGSPATDLLLRHLKENDTGQPVINYRTSTSDGRPLRSSTLFLHDNDGNVVGCLCINIDISHAVALRELLDMELGEHAQNSSSSGPVTRPQSQYEEETFEQDAEDMFRKAIDAAVASRKRSLSSLTKQDRVAIVKALDERGLFLARNAPQITAKMLGLSRATIYNYLNQIRG